MRQFIDIIQRANMLTEQMLMEGPGGGLYFHISPTRNTNSIMDHGLIPNYGGGNYEDNEWISLDGVYASRNAEHLRSIMETQDITDFLIIVIEVADQIALPDEDLLTGLLKKVSERLYNAHGAGVGKKITYNFSADISFWKEVMHEFDKEAGGNGSYPPFLWDFVKMWAFFKHYVRQAHVDPDEWKAVKDQVVRYYHNAGHPEKGQYSIRIPHAVGFHGDTKIVAIIGVDEFYEKYELIYGDLPLPDEVNLFFKTLTSVNPHFIEKSTSEKSSRHSK